MPFTMNDSNFPVVTAIGSKDMTDDNEVIMFHNYWKKLYERKQNFTFILFLDDVESMQLKTAYMTAKIIKDMKTLPEQYLKKTIVVFKDQIIINIARVLFSIQSPISQIFLLNSTKNNIKSCIKSILEGNIPDENIPMYDSCYQK